MPLQDQQGTAMQSHSTVAVPSLNPQQVTQQQNPRNNPDKPLTAQEPELPAKTPTKENKSQTLTPIQSKYTSVPHPHMKPDNSIQHHPAFDTLMNYATAGCPVDHGPEWSHEHIMAAIMRRPHISAKSLKLQPASMLKHLKKLHKDMHKLSNGMTLSIIHPKISKYCRLWQSHTKAAYSKTFWICHSNCNTMNNNLPA